MPTGEVDEVLFSEGRVISLNMWVERDEFCMHSKPYIYKTSRAALRFFAKFRADNTNLRISCILDVHAQLVEMPSSK
ncbi:hypothetical protein KIN20_025304 [Parelaphostrongylus tenuis]|uniref:Uncharacterized protein n=1 Tax=Parelaphostrongylus tenuis TaxID=148309 RepID=A0AAD5QX73_PARTN|nr:hypothetical protein KIN20_025304 [Parelaphostrongylus tenuis]